jgi:hypothetical protein
MAFYGGLLIGVMLASTAWAQSSLVGGALEGAVADSTRARIPGASVTARDVSTHQAREVTTNGEGIFRIQELAPGTYEISISQPGFAAYHHVTVQLGATTHLDVALQSAGVSTQINGHGSAAAARSDANVSEYRSRQGTH